jgi:hypothetical protein
MRRLVAAVVVAVAGSAATIAWVVMAANARAAHHRDVATHADTLGRPGGAA